MKKTIDPSNPPDRQELENYLVMKATQTAAKDKEQGN